ncbi:MAG: trigger factor [Gammaproteobacteria bacterium]|nr:trigger factor [Gammaproteobacteria bacterium]
MQVTVETTQGLERRMRVEIPEEKVRGEVDKRLGDLARSVRIPGFRPGRAPVKVVARRYGRQVRDEVVGGLVQESLIDALSQEQLRPAAAPRIAPLETTAGVSYTATFDVLPEIALPRFETIEIARPVATVIDADVARMLETMRAQRRTWGTVERAAASTDRVVVNFEALVDGEPVDEASATELPVELDAGRMVDGFEDALIGMQAGEERTLELTFPQNYPEHLAGKPVTFNVKVHRVEEPELPDLDDAFAESFGVSEGGLDALRDEVRANMERELADGLRRTLKRHVMEALLAGNEIELPESMVRDEVARAMQRRREELARSGIDPQRVELTPDTFDEPVRRRLSLDLLIAEIVKEHRIELDHARVRAQVESIASTYQDPARVLDWYYSDRERLSGIESLVFEDQVVDWILERAQIVDEPASFDRILNPGQTDAATA